MCTQNIENEKLLQVEGLQTSFFLDEGIVRAVQDVSFSVSHNDTLGIVGESGCGKSVTAFSILQIIEPPGKIVGGRIIFRRKHRGGNGSAETIDLASLDRNSRQMRTIRGAEIAMIFQEPMTSLSPVHTIGDQIVEAICLHRDLTRREARHSAIEVLQRVGIPAPEQRFDAYPFQLSGGMRQRAMIAMALSCEPSLLIADEPTTALDVTTQAQIIELIRRLQADLGMAVVLITHNLGVVAETCQNIAVMYLGQVVESAPTDAIFHDPLHPYTRALLKSMPRLGQTKASRLTAISGSVPDPFERPSGCFFGPRCQDYIADRCDKEMPPITRLADRRTVRCFLYT